MNLFKLFRLEGNSFTARDWQVAILIVIVGLGLRLYPGRDHLIWSYDQARDVYRARSVIEDRDLKLVGPQTEYVGLNHGPLHYYFWAPFLTFAKGDPNWLVGAWALWNLSALVPIGLLAQALFKNKKITLLALLIFTVAYQQVEYSRWLSNVALTIPFLAWTYYFLWRNIKHHQYFYLTGLSLGLAIQGEIFLLYLIPVIYLFYLGKSLSLKQWGHYHLGLASGLITFILAELKYGFLGAKTFIFQFLSDQAHGFSSPTAALTMYLDHWGLTFYQNILGISAPMGLLAIMLIMALVIKHWSALKKDKYFPQLQFLFLLLISHAILFTFKAIDAVFLDLSVLVPLYLLVSYFLFLIWSKSKWVGGSLILVVIFSQLLTLKNMVHRQTPMAAYGFIQDGILLSQKLEIVDQMHQLVGTDQPFSLSVLGTPYGVRSVWASVFELDHLRTGRPLPVWQGWVADGYEGEELLVKSDHPLTHHILLIESNQDLISPYVRAQHLEHQNATSQLVSEKELFGYKIQLRQPFTEESPK